MERSHNLAGVQPYACAVYLLLALSVMGLGCSKQKPPPPPSEPKPQLFPEPPALPSSTECVVRRFDASDGKWRVAIHPYDEVTRILDKQQPLQFDEQGRLVARGEPGSDSRATFTYDDQGNLREELLGPPGRIRAGTRWDNSYEGDPSRLVDQMLREVDEKGRAGKRHSRIHFRYDTQGRVIEELNEGARERWTRELHWKGSRLVRILWTYDPRSSQAKLPFDGDERFAYDAEGRLIAHTVDGEILFGELASADGEPEQRTTFQYDVAGHLVRIERDGQGGDIGPEAPDGIANGITLLTPQCDALTELAPHLFDMPELYLPRSIAPRFR
jgi:YD repeat-containing protein